MDEAIRTEVLERMAIAVNVLSPEMKHCGMADGLYFPEGRMTLVKTGGMRVAPRGLRQRYDTTRKHWELGRTLSFCPKWEKELGTS